LAFVASNQTLTSLNIADYLVSHRNRQGRHADKLL
jgi:hypothetical protein